MAGLDLEGLVQPEWFSDSVDLCPVHACHSTYVAYTQKLENSLPIPFSCLPLPDFSFFLILHFVSVLHFGSIPHRAVSDYKGLTNKKLNLSKALQGIQLPSFAK